MGVQVFFFLTEAALEPWCSGFLFPDAPDIVDSPLAFRLKS